MLKNEDWKRMLLSASKVLEDNEDMLTQLDSATGDGDHGITIKKIADVIRHETEAWIEGQSLKSLLGSASFKIMNVKGGSAGPLWGTMFEGFSEGAAEQDEINTEDLRRMFTGSLKSLSEISTAKVGEKTMMDALVPAVKAIEESKGDIEDMLAEAAKAAKEGADNTENYIAKFGRAKTLKEKSLGHKDPGAVSLSLFIEGLALGARK